MSELPTRPSLNYLRKQAKELLEHLRERNPSVTLVEAQHALAQEYGFASWPKLKAQVERLATLPPPVTFRRYTPKAREAVFFGWNEAKQSGSPTVEPEHVLVGVIRASQGLRGRLFERTNVSPDRERRELLRSQPAAASPSSEHVSVGARAQQVFRAAAEEADSFEHARIGLAHILIGVLRAQDPKAAILLEPTGVTLEGIRDRIAQLLNEEPL